MRCVTPSSPPRQFGVAQCPGNAERMDDAEGPSIPGMGQHFPLQPVIIVAERVASRLRARNHLIEVQVIERYHACTFFFIPTVSLILPSGS